jgi:hypothetical protein
MCDILIKRSILPEQWNQAKECVKGQSRNADLKTVKSCAQNATNTRLKILKKLMRIALENDLIKKSPFVGYKFKYHETNPDFLTMEEIQRIASKKITIRCIEQVRDVFVFQRFTGLAFGNVAQLSAEHLVKGQNGDVWIHKTRQKTKNM